MFPLPFLPLLLLLLSLSSFFTLPVQSYDFSPTLPASSVPDAQKSDWCTTHLETCRSICGTGMGTDLLGVKTNVCQPASLSYECICNRDHLRPKMQLFHYTVPGLMCEAAWKACRKTNEGNAQVVKECDDQIRQRCGHMRTKDQVTKNEGIYEFFKPIKGGGKRRRVGG